MAYATVEDVEARLGRGLTGPDRARVQALLDDAAAAIDAYLGPRNVVADASIARAVSCAMLLRVIDVPQGIQQETVGGVSRTYVTGGDGGQWLTDVEQRLLVGIVGGLRSVRLSHTAHGDLDTEVAL